jgi:hypothetical protein
LLFAWLTLWPVITPLPVSSQRRAMRKTLLLREDECSNRDKIRAVTAAEPKCFGSAFRIVSGTCRVKGSTVDVAAQTAAVPAIYRRISASTLNDRMIRFLLVLASLAWLPMPASASTSLRAEYAVTIRGIIVGTASLTATIEGSHYSAEFSGGIVGLARLFSDARTSAHATGRIGKSGLQPQEYGHLWDEDDETETVELRFSGPTLTEIALDPPIERPQRYVPVTAKQKIGVLDPLSALLWPNSAEATPDVCDRTLPVFDGKRRFDLALSFIRKDSSKVGGAAIVCGVRYVPISGHRTKGDGDTFLKDGEGMEVWVSSTGSGLILPVKIQLDTRIGRLVFRATAFEVGPVSAKATGQQSRTE